MGKGRAAESVRQSGAVQPPRAPLDTEAGRPGRAFRTAVAAHPGARASAAAGGARTAPVGPPPARRDGRRTLSQTTHRSLTDRLVSAVTVANSTARPPPLPSAS